MKFHLDQLSHNQIHFLPLYVLLRNSEGKSIIYLKEYIYHQPPDPNGISRTLSARYYKDGSEILIAQDGKNPRRLTPRECARLQGFPENFKIPVSDTQAYKQFGNSVVVPLYVLLRNSEGKSIIYLEEYIYHQPPDPEYLSLMVLDRQV